MEDTLSLLGEDPILYFESSFPLCCHTRSVDCTIEAYCGKIPFDNTFKEIQDLFPFFFA